MDDEDERRPPCIHQRNALRQRRASQRGRGYFMFFAAMYTSPFIGAYILGRYAYRQAEQVAITQRRKRVCKRAEDRDVTLHPSKKPEATEANIEHSLLRLPVELRLQIYDLVYAPSQYIIIKDSGQKGHVQGVTWSKTYCPCVRSGCCSYSECTVPIPNDILALSLTCRLFYSETIAFVYSKNTFHFNQYEVISSLPIIIPAKHLRNIRSLSLNFAVDKLIRSLNLVIRNPSAKPDSPSYRFGMTIFEDPHERKDEWMKLWRLLADNLIRLQRLSVTFNRLSPKGIPPLEKQICEWAIQSLLTFNTAERTIPHLDVYLGFAWKQYVTEMEQRFTGKCGISGLPFTLKSTWGCIHDFY